MIQNSYDSKNNELHSEKVRLIIQQIPVGLQRFCDFFILITILIVSMVCYFLPYKRYIPIDVRIFSLPEIINIYAPNNGIVSVKCCDVTNVRDSLLLGYFVDKENITPILASSPGRLLRNVTNEEYVFSEDLLFSIIPDIECVYGKFEIASHDYLSLDPNKKILIKSNVGKIYTGEICRTSIIEDSDRISITFKFDDIMENELLNSYFSAFLLFEELNLLKKLLFLFD